MFSKFWPLQLLVVVDAVVVVDSAVSVAGNLKESDSGDSGLHTVEIVYDGETVLVQEAAKLKTTSKSEADTHHKNKHHKHEHKHEHKHTQTSAAQTGSKTDSETKTDFESVSQKLRDEVAGTHNLWVFWFAFPKKNDSEGESDSLAEKEPESLAESSDVDWEAKLRDVWNELERTAQGDRLEAFRHIRAAFENSDTDEKDSSENSLSQSEFPTKLRLVTSSTLLLYSMAQNKRDLYQWQWQNVK
jgi:hypothetical protein